MASLRVVVVSALLACVLADTLTADQLRQHLQDAVTACAHEDSVSCTNLCQYKYVGMIDKDGRYVESKVAEAMATMVYDGVLNQEQVTKIAKTCNSVNEDIKTGCERGQQVFSCIDDERFKITGKRL